MQLVYEDMPQESGSYQCKRICKRIRDMETNMAVNMGDKSVYIYGPSGPREISQSTSLRSIQSNRIYYYMICKEVTCTEIVILTHRLRTHSRRLIHKSSHATTGICNRELPWTSMVFQALMHIKTELLL